MFQFLKLESSFTFKCYFAANKAKFYQVFNGKIRRIASQEVILALIKSKRLPILLYETEDSEALFTIRFNYLVLQTLTLSMTVGGILNSNYPAKKRAKFERKFADHKNLHRYFGICVI